MKHLKLAVALLAIALGGCIPIKGDVNAGSRSTILNTATPLRSGEAIAILGAKPQDEEIANCIRGAVAKASPTIPIVAPEKLRLTSDDASGSANAPLPDQEFGSRLREPASLHAISDLGIRYVFTVEGSTVEKDHRSTQGNTYPTAFVAEFSSRKITNIDVAIWDATTGQRQASIHTTATGQPNTVFIVAVGFWSYAPTESTACESTAGQLLRYLAGESHP
jgi:hypothetical protein